MNQVMSVKKFFYFFCKIIILFFFFRFLVIRNKLGHMISKIEGSQANLENLTFQMNNMNLKQRVRYLAGILTSFFVKTEKGKVILFL